uniref:IAA-alanine resistance protein 1 n=1 Tax=Steinernema glaseri TaxID=37863 RepID=A0A1I7ZZ12_9BILA
MGSCAGKEQNDCSHEKKNKGPAKRQPFDLPDPTSPEMVGMAIANDMLDSQHHHHNHHHHHVEPAPSHHHHHDFGAVHHHHHGF